MSLASGSRLGPYEVVSLLGAGGMGEVFRARDTKLNRDVAIKVLPAGFAEDKERVARFRREAQLLASLNHPNIAAIYGLEESNGTVALALELVDGEDLAQRLASGPLPVDEAIAIARQIAEGLEAAHEKGIVHRDLKPANVKLTRGGTVKILDFGLAKAFEGDASSTESGLSQSPTMSRHMTEAGMILGTAAYMSPEQARGRTVDKRSDIWSFGVVLHEMLTGKRLFGGETVSDTLAAVLRLDVDLAALPSETPVSVRRLLSRCLDRDMKRRLRDIGDARFELESGGAAPVPAAAVSRRGVPSALAVASALLLALAAAAAAWLLKPRPLAEVPPLVKATYPIGAPFRGALRRRQIAISPDGRVIATIAGLRVALRRLDELTTSPLAGTDGATSMLFSPDSRWIAFTTDTAIKKVAVASGEVTPVVDVGAGLAGGPIGACWGDDGLIYYAMLDGIRAVPANGGESKIVVGGSNLRSPDLLPGSRWLLYGRGGSPTDVSGSVVLRALDSGKETVLTTGGNPRFASSGELVVARAESLLVAPLDLASPRLLAEPASVVQGVGVVAGISQYDVSRNGTLVYVPRSSQRSPLFVPRRVPSNDAAPPLTRTAREYSDPRVSPDGRHIAFHVEDELNDVWTLDLARDALTRITFDPQEDETPAWSPDGQWLAYSGYTRDRGSGMRCVFRRRADGSGGEDVLFTLPEHTHVTDWSPDGKRLVVDVIRPESKSDIDILELEGTPALRPYLATPFEESSGRVSPDGKWLAYRSSESGQDEIYLQPFPAPGAKTQVSTGGGTQPVWSRDGRALYFRSESSIMVARVMPGTSVAFGAPEPLVKDVYGRPQGIGHTTYDVFPDGTFVGLQPAEPTAASFANPVLVAVFNWLQNLPARAPSPR